ncbi:hypothetical protein E2320_004560, partial [Naja naja]
MHAKCKQCNKEMQGLKLHHEKCCDERTMFEEAGVSVSVFSLQDSASVTSFTHIHNISPKRKKPSGTTTIDKFVIKASILEKDLTDAKIAQFVYATNSIFRVLEKPVFFNIVQSLRLGYIH